MAYAVWSRTRNWVYWLSDRRHLEWTDSKIKSIHNLNCDFFYGNPPFCVFETPLGVGGLRRNVRRSSYAHWKAHSGLNISVYWTFLLGVTAEELRANICSKLAISLQRGPVDPKFQVEWVAPTTIFSQKTRLNDLSYDIKIWTDLSSVLSQITRLTDRRTDRQNSHR